VKQAPLGSLAQRVKPRLARAVLRILEKKQRLMKEHLFGFLLADTMPVVFARIARIPIKSLDSSEV